jgi:hypothetical protein
MGAVAPVAVGCDLPGAAAQATLTREQHAALARALVG